MVQLLSAGPSWPVGPKELLIYEVPKSASHMDLTQLVSPWSVEDVHSWFEASLVGGESAQWVLLAKAL